MPFSNIIGALGSWNPASKPKQEDETLTMPGTTHQFGLGGVQMQMAMAKEAQYAADLANAFTKSQSPSGISQASHTGMHPNPGSYTQYHTTTGGNLQIIGGGGGGVGGAYYQAVPNNMPWVTVPGTYAVPNRYLNIDFPNPFDGNTFDCGLPVGARLELRLRADGTYDVVSIKSPETIMDKKTGDGAFSLEEIEDAHRVIEELSSK